MPKDSNSKHLGTRSQNVEIQEFPADISMAHLEKSSNNVLDLPTEHHSKFINDASFMSEIPLVTENDDDQRGPRIDRDYPAAQNVNINVYPHNPSTDNLQTFSVDESRDHSPKSATMSFCIYDYI